ncbi:hypothetical protein RFI_20028, partial [Reticulomyxa filosa]
DAKTESIDVNEGGYANCNGEYRWFFRDKRWVKFDDSESFVIEPNVPASEVYDQLERVQGEERLFRWKSSVTHCWAICDPSREHIYYAAPMRNPDRIQNFEWISVHGSKPEPKLTVGAHQSEYHDIGDIQTGNVSGRFLKSSKRPNATHSSLIGQVIEEEKAFEDPHLPKDRASEEDQPEKGGDDEQISDLEG